MKKLTVCILSMALVLGVFAVGFGASKDLLRIGTTDRVTNLSPANSYNLYTWHVLRACSDSLLKIKPKSTEVAPALAKDWEVGPLGAVYTFHLREDVTFTNGDPLTAEDVKWSFERAMKLDGAEGGVFLIKQPIDTIKVLDKYTLKITLKEPNATFLKRVTGQVAPALVWNKNGTPNNTFTQGKFVGVGPYKLKKYQPNQSVVFTAYEDYYAGAPKTKTVVELKYANSTSLRTALEAGDIDIAFRTLNPVDINDLEEDAAFKTQHVKNCSSVRYMVFNVTNKPFDNRKVRQAISYAVDRSKIVEQVFSGVADPIYSMVPKGWNGRLATFPKQDLKKAEELLAEAGYTAENPMKVTLWYTPKHYGTTEADVAAVLDGSLEEVPSINLQVKSLEWGAFTEREAKGGLGMFLLGWYPDYLEASNFLEPWITGAPEGLGTFFNKHPAHDTYKKLFEAAKSIPETEPRGTVYEAVQQLTARDVMFIPLWSNVAQTYVIMRNNVKNCFVDATMDIRIAGIYKE